MAREAKEKEEIKAEKEARKVREKAEEKAREIREKKEIEDEKKARKVREKTKEKAKEARGKKEIEDENTKEVGEKKEIDDEEKARKAREKEEKETREAKNGPGWPQALQGTSTRALAPGPAPTQDKLEVVDRRARARERALETRVGWHRRERTVYATHD